MTQITSLSSLSIPGSSRSIFKLAENQPDPSSASDPLELKLCRLRWMRRLLGAATGTGRVGSTGSLPAGSGGSRKGQGSRASACHRVPPVVVSGCPIPRLFLSLFSALSAPRTRKESAGPQRGDALELAERNLPINGATAGRSTSFLKMTMVKYL